MTERMQTAVKEVSPRLHAERLTLQEMHHVATSYGHALRAGIEGRSSSLAMLPTRLHSVNLAAIDPTKKALVVEMGGTNVYGGLIGVVNGKAELQEHRQVSLSSLKNKRYQDSQEFFNEIASDVLPLVRDAPDALGIIWSFPATVSSGEHGIDAISSEALPKEFVIPGVSKKPIGDQLVGALQAVQPAISGVIQRAVVNDTAAVLLANGGTIGGIVGTGFNLAFAHNGQIYNTESGGFEGVPQTPLTKKVDVASAAPGKFLAEKQISGAYIGNLFTEVAKALGMQLQAPLQSEDMSALLAKNVEPVITKIPDATPAQLYNLTQEASILRDRSAQLVASMVVGAMKEFPGSFSGERVVIPIEGSFFGKTPGYQEAVALYAQQLLPEKDIQFAPVEKSGIKGAGVAALGLL